MKNKKAEKIIKYVFIGIMLFSMIFSGFIVLVYAIQGI